MTAVQVAKLSQQQIAELACTYAALILYDDGQDITGDKLSKLIVSSGVKVESFWPKLFAKAIEGKDISSFFNFAGSSPAAVGPAPTSASTTAAPVADKKADNKAADKKKPEPKPEPPKEEEEDAGMGGLFD